LGGHDGRNFAKKFMTIAPQRPAGKTALSLLFSLNKIRKSAPVNNADATEAGDEYNWHHEPGSRTMNKLKQGNVPVKSFVVPNVLD